METQNQIQLLRHHLLDMSKLAHRAVDYAIKGYRLGSPEFCRFVRRGDHQLGELRRRIKNLCHTLVKDLAIDPASFADETVTNPDIRFIISALRICDALHAICTAASEIAHHTIILLEDATQPLYETLEKLCFLTNRLICLSIVGLFKKEDQHAETVMQHGDLVARLSDHTSHDLRSADRISGISIALQLAITNSLAQISRQANEIAEATIFWLKGGSRTFTIGELMPSASH